MRPTAYRFGVLVCLFTTIQPAAGEEPPERPKEIDLEEFSGNRSVPGASVHFSLLPQ